MIPSLPILCCKSSVAVKENSDSKKLLQFVLVVNYCFKALDLRYLWVPFEISRITFKSSYVKICAIWYHLYNLKSVKNTHGGVLLLVKLQAKSLQLYLLKVTLLHGCFSRFLNLTNGTKSRNASQILKLRKLSIFFFYVNHVIIQSH